VAGIAAIFRRDDPAAANPAIQIAHFALDFSRKESVRRGSAAMEFELIDTGLFDFLLRHRASPDIESVAGCLRQECRWWVVGQLDCGGY
jgi:hypothetical protein